LKVFVPLTRFTVRGLIIVNPLGLAFGVVALLRQHGNRWPATWGIVLHTLIFVAAILFMIT
jgi:hypothetical protein